MKVQFSSPQAYNLARHVHKLGLSLRTEPRDTDSHYLLSLIREANVRNGSLVCMPGEPDVYVDSLMLHTARRQGIDLLFKHPRPLEALWETWDVKAINPDIVTIEETYLEDGIFFALHDNEHVVGYAALRTVPSTDNKKVGYVSTYMLPEWRGESLHGKGLGNHFWKALIEQAKIHGYQRLEAVCHKSFKPSIHLAGKHGLRESSYQEKRWVFLELDLDNEDVANTKQLVA